jgi:hypothetical protein
VTSLEVVLAECSATAGLQPEEQLAWYDDVIGFFDVAIARVASGQAQGLVLHLAVASWRVANRKLVADPVGRATRAWLQLHRHLASDYVASQAAHDLLREVEQFLKDN